MIITKDSSLRTIAKFFSRTSNAIIAGAATVIAALITVIGVAKHEERSRSRDVAELQSQILLKSRESAELHDALDKSQRSITELQARLAAVERRTPPIVPSPETNPDAKTGNEHLPPKASTPTETTPVVVETAGFAVTLEGCQRFGDTVVCHLIWTNHEGERTFFIAANEKSTRAIDANGNESYAVDAALGSQVSRAPMVSIPSFVPLRAWVRFRGISAQTQTFTLLQIQAWTHQLNEFEVEFRDVRLQP